MHNSCAQEMWMPIRYGYRNGTPVPKRCTTEMKIRIVAAAISEAIRISSSRSRIRSSTNVPLRACPKNALVGHAAGFLDEFVDQGLTDPGGDILVDRLHRLAHGDVLLRRQGVDFGLAGLLDGLQRLLVFLGRLPVAEGGGFLHGLFELAANVGGKSVPDSLVHDHDIADIAVVGHG